jgi:hypothetical protein
MRTKRRTWIVRSSVMTLAVALGILAVAVAPAFAAPDIDECGLGGAGCNNVGITDGWFEGQTVDFKYTHDFFCGQPPSSGAQSGCEVGEGTDVQPPAGEVGEEVYVLIPVGFSAPQSTLHCPVPGRCIDHPRTIDLSDVMGPGTENALFPVHSFVIDDDEEFLGVWWPVEVIGVNSRAAWQAIAKAKSLGEVRHQQELGNATDDIETNLFLFFAVLEGPDED